jgi:NDP-sugar pyrophosphorylase family protein
MIKSEKVKLLKFFVLAAGYGKRAQPLSLIKPKPVFPLDGTPLLQIMLKQLTEKGLREGFINLHHLPEPIRQCAESMLEKSFTHFLYEEELSGSLILKGALPGMEEDDVLLVVNGDIFLEIPVEEMLRQIVEDSGTDGILLVRHNKEMDARYKAILTKDKPFRERITGGNIFTGRKIHNGSDSESMGESMMYTGVSLFRKKVIQAIADINFFDSLERYKFRIKVLPYDGIWLDIGDPPSYMEANFSFKSYVKAGSGDFNSVSENVIISPDSLVEHSILWENTEIKNKSVIKNCIVTGNCSLDHVRCENHILCTTPKLRLHPLFGEPGVLR